MFGKSNGEKGFLYNKSECESEWKVGCMYGPFVDRETACGGMTVAAVCVDKIVGCPGFASIGLNVFGMGGRAGAGIVPANGGDTKSREKKQ